jgi:hypothetical protein
MIRHLELLLKYALINSLVEIGFNFNVPEAIFHRFSQLVDVAIHGILSVKKSQLFSF